jgi:hypothetical protein
VSEGEIEGGTIFGGEELCVKGENVRGRKKKRTHKKV